jgi:8-oxo-dGTP pyrophosphatase MutT (NUDIX family)
LPGATAVVLREGASGLEVLLVERADDGAWSSVCGIVDPGEEPGEAAVREVAEEAGVVVEVERLVWMSVTDLVTYYNGDQTQYIDHTFRCRWVSGEPYPADGEATAARWYPADALPDMPRVHRDRIDVALADRPECLLGRLAS